MSEPPIAREEKPAPGTGRLHVLVVPSWYPSDERPLSGVFFQEQAVALAKAGMQVGVIYPDLPRFRVLGVGPAAKRRFQVVADESPHLTVLRSRGLQAPKSLSINKRLWLHQAARLMRCYLRSHGEPDILHAHGALWGGVAARELARRYSIPYVVTEHSTAIGMNALTPWQRSHLSSTYGDADAVISVSEGLAMDIQPYAKPNTVRVVPNVVNTDFFTLPRERPAPKPFRFLTVALLTPKKGIDVLLRSFAEAFAGSPEVVLEIGGDGDQRGTLESLADSLGIRERVTFRGLLSREMVREAMWRSHAFVLPSRFETFGVVLIEAMATGVPVVATSSGGPEYFVGPETGLLVPPGDAPSLIEALGQLRHAHFQYDRQTIRTYAVENFGEFAVASQLEQVYRETLRLRTATRPS